MKRTNDENQGDWEELLTIENNYFVKRLFCHLKSSLKQGVFRWIIEKKEKLQKELIRIEALHAEGTLPESLPVREIRISLN